MHIIRIWLLSIVIAAAVFASRDAPAATVSIFDGTFDDADWDLFGPFNSPGISCAVSAGQVPVGGNPGAYRENENQFTAPFNAGCGSISVFNAVSYDPSTQGPISSIDVSFDNKLFFLDGTVSGMLFEFIIVQDDIAYSASGVSALADNPVDWVNLLATGLVESTFGALRVLPGGALAPNFGAPPDFSSAGLPIFFGYSTGNSSSSGVQNTINAGIDNFGVTIQITEPPAMAMGALGLALVGAVGIARRRKAGRQTVST